MLRQGRRPRRPVSAVPLGGILVLAAALPAAGAERNVTGALGYPAQSALPEGARMVVEARDADGALLAVRRTTLDGQQSPLPFEIEVPEEGPVTIRAALFDSARAEWVSGPLTVESGTGAVDLPKAELTRFVPIIHDRRMICGETDLRVGFLGEAAVAEIAGARVRLVPVESASGSRFVDPENRDTWVWTKGDAALVSLDGEELPECDLLVPVEMLPYHAQGNEPGWTLEITAREITLETASVDDGVSIPLPSPVAEGGARVFRHEGGRGVEARVTPTLCRDSMTGMPYPDTVHVAFGDESLMGCGGLPVSLLTGGAWQVRDVGLYRVADGQAVIMIFTRGGRVAGEGGCNRYSAGFEITGESLRIESAVATRMACSGEQMQTEERFLETLGTITRFDFDPTGALLLLDQDGRTAIRADRG